MGSGVFEFRERRDPVGEPRIICAEPFEGDTVDREEADVRHRPYARSPAPVQREECTLADDAART
jgi:hypothetical protein